MVVQQYCICESIIAILSQATVQALIVSSSVRNKNELQSPMASQLMSKMTLNHRSIVSQAHPQKHIELQTSGFVQYPLYTSIMFTVTAKSSYVLNNITLLSNLQMLATLSCLK